MILLYVANVVRLCIRQLLISPHWFIFLALINNDYVNWFKVLWKLLPYKCSHKMKRTCRYIHSANKGCRPHISYIVQIREYPERHVYDFVYKIGMNAARLVQNKRIPKNEWLFWKRICANIALKHKSEKFIVIISSPVIIKFLVI